jgi:hypothetical protein
MPIDFPNSPTVNQEFTVDGNVWKWTGTTWDIVLQTVVGPTGPTGLTGLTGATGPTGAGYDGITATTTATSVEVEASVNLLANKTSALIVGSQIRVMIDSSTFFEGRITAINTVTISPGVTKPELVTLIQNVSWSGTSPDPSSATLSVGLVGVRGLDGIQGDTGPTGADAPDITEVNVVTSGPYTLVASDKSKLIEVNSTDNIIVRVPSDSVTNFQIGATITILRFNTGTVTIQGDGVNPSLAVNATPSNSLRARYSSASLVKRAADAWILVGDLA